MAGTRAMSNFVVILLIILNARVFLVDLELFSKKNYNILIRKYKLCKKSCYFQLVPKPKRYVNLRGV